MQPKIGIEKDKCEQQIAQKDVCVSKNKEKNQTGKF